MIYRSYFTTAEELESQLSLPPNDCIQIMYSLSLYGIVPLPNTICFENFVGFTDTHIMSFCDDSIFFLISDNCENIEINYPSI